MIKNRQINFIISLYFGCFCLLLVASFKLSVIPVKADDCSDSCTAAYPTDTNAESDCEDKCHALEDKAAAYEKILKLNDKTQSALNDQLSYINQQQATNQQNLNNAQNKLSDLSNQITVLESSIAEKEQSIDYQKKILAGLMQSYYDYDQQGILKLILVNETLSASLSQSDYIEQSSSKASDILQDIRKTQQELIQNKENLSAKYNETSRIKDQLDYQKSNLLANENQKQSLLVQTQGQEQKYQDLLARVEQEKNELFNFSSASNLNEILDSVKNYPRPSSNLASTSWYFSQTDSRWANQRIGNSNSTMEDYGCAVTSLSMVFRKMGSNIDPGKMAKQKIFYYDLIEWPLTWDGGISLISSVSHGNVSWSKIDSQISNNHPVIVHIAKTNGGGGHYVVITGKDSKDYIVHDPYFGPNLYLGTSTSLVGKIGNDSKTKIDQMIIYN